MDAAGTSTAGNVVSLDDYRHARLEQDDPKVQNTSAMRLVVVEWRIRPDREAEFLDYWSQREVVPERDGLIGEFLSRVDLSMPTPWITWALDPRCTTFINVGLWSSGEAFREQIGYAINDARPLQPFEAERRRRIVLAPERWRAGGTHLPQSEHPFVS